MTALGGNMQNRKLFMRLFLGEINLFCLLRVEADTIAKMTHSILSMQFLEWRI